MGEIWQKIVHWSNDIKHIALHNLLLQAYSWNKPGEKRRGLCKGLEAITYPQLSSVFNPTTTHGLFPRAYAVFVFYARHKPYSSSYVSMRRGQ